MCRLEVIAKTGTVKAEPHMEAKLKTKKSLRSARDGQNRLCRGDSKNVARTHDSFEATIE